jgi:hypothetical protein
VVRKEDVDRFALKRPFEPFEIRLVDGQRFRFSRAEELLVGRTMLATLGRAGVIMHINMDLIATIGPLQPGGRRRPREASGDR